ncbi:hypothetical protein KA107_01085 [Candidatus Pacearchaeota archaeon]|nr:hypothetical protein [Candidatus Pacearchaeota archaeon]
MANKSSSKEDLQLAEEHIKLAEDLVSDAAKKTDKTTVIEKLTKAQFDLEKAEVDVDQVTEEDFTEEIGDD